MKLAINAGVLALFVKSHQILQLSVLAQGSEFAFIIFGMAAVQGLIGVNIAAVLIAAIVLTMIVSAMAILSHKLSRQICGPLCDSMTDDGAAALSKSQGGQRAVFIVGMNAVGQTLARALSYDKIAYVGVDHDRERFLNATTAGYIVAFGRREDIRFWDILGIRRARALVVAHRYKITQSLSPMIKRCTQFASLCRLAKYSE